MATQDVFSQYIESIGNRPLLSAEAEAALVQRARRAKRVKNEAEHRAAINELVEANLRLVIRIAKGYARSGRSVTDLVQDGNIGLIKAAEAFDGGLGYRFSTFADWWVRKAIQKGIWEDRTVYLPEHTIERINAITRASHAFVMQHGREPEPSEIATEVELSVRQVEEAIEAITETVSTSSRVSDTDDVELGDTLPCTDPSVIETIEGDETVSRVDEILGCLTPQDEFVVRARFGFYDDLDTRPNVKKELGLSDDGVSAVFQRAMAKLRSAHGDALGALVGEAA